MLEAHCLVIRIFKSQEKSQGLSDTLVDVMTFLMYYVHVLECLPSTRYKESPNQIVLNDVLWLKGTPYDTL